MGQMPTAVEGAPLEARWIVARIHSVAAEVNAALGEYRFHEAANVVYQFSGAISATGIWKSSSCVWILSESAKGLKRSHPSCADNAFEDV